MGGKELTPLTKLLNVLIILLFLVGGGRSAALAQASYTYSFHREAVPGPEAYRHSREVYGEDIGTGSFKEPEDLFVSSENLVYIADTGNHRIVVLDENLDLVKVLTGFETDGGHQQFRSPMGLFVTEAGDLYVADYGNGRVVVLNRQGELQKTIANPRDNELIPESFVFKPLRVVVDRSGRVYVIAEGVLEGLMEFDEFGAFSGFIGAPRVSPDPWDLLWRRFMTEEQKQRSVLFLPTEYSNADIDARGFIYTTVFGSTTETGQVIRKLNPSGADVLRRNGFTAPRGDVDVVFAEENLNATITGRSYLVDIVVRQHGIYSVLDLRRGRVFTYDDDGRLLYAFGAPTAEKGGLRVPSAIDTIGDSLLILEKGLNAVAVYEPTRYAEAIHAAIAHIQSGEYDEATEMWREVLRRNPNLDMAYSGIGRSLLSQGLFAEAMEMYRLGSDREGYSKALSLYRRGWVNEHFSIILTVVIVLIAAYLVYRILASRKKSQGSEGYRGLAFERKDTPLGAYFQSLRYALHVIFHPFDGFWDLKHERRGSVSAATTILIFVTITYIMARQYTGFIFNYNDVRRLNIYMEFVSVLLPFMLWCGVNLALTSLVDGKGSFKDIYITTAYGLVPVVLMRIPLIALSNVITLQEGAFYFALNTIAVLWAGFLVFTGIQTIHEYDLKANFFTCVLTGVGMGLVVFICLLFVNVLAQTIGFLNTVYMELTFRL